jgi:DNA-binding IclR family transcriptional regulator
MQGNGTVGGVASVDSFFVTRTMRVIEMLAFEPATAPEIAGELRVDARTARRLLNRLAAEGWVIRTEGRVRTYSLSLRLVAMAEHFAARVPLAVAAREPLAALHRGTGATTYLTVPSYRSVLCLVHGGGGPVPGVHELIPAHANAGGKLLLAHRRPWRESVLELPLERLTARTIVDPDVLRDECDWVRRAELATEDGEYREGLHGLAAPVRDAEGEVVAAVVLTSPAEVELGAHSDAVRGAAAAIERELAETGARAA